MTSSMHPTLGRIRHEDDGFSLVELMTTIMIGTIIVLAAFAATDAANRLQNKTSMRIDAVSRGRNAMEVITGAIRAQQCYNSTRPMVWASDTGMEFYASSGQFSASTPVQPLQLIRLEWKASTATASGGSSSIYKSGSVIGAASPVGDITKTVYSVDATGLPVMSSAVTSIIAREVERAPDRRTPTAYAPFFQYFDYSTATGSGRIDYTSPSKMVASAASTFNPAGLASAPVGDLAGMVLVEINFRVSPRNARGEYTTPTSPLATAAQDMDFYNTVSVRIADPTNPAGSPQCL